MAWHDLTKTCVDMDVDVDANANADVNADVAAGVPVMVGHRRHHGVD